MSTTRNLNKEFQWSAQKKNSQNWGDFANWLAITQSLQGSNNSSVLLTLYNGTFNLNTTSDQLIDLSQFGNKFAQLNIVLYSPSIGITTAKALQFWDGASKTGNEYYTTAFTDGGDGLQNLLQNSWISFDDGDLIYATYMQNNKFELPNKFYVSLGTAQGAAATCAIVITGIKLS